MKKSKDTKPLGKEKQDSTKKPLKNPRELLPVNSPYLKNIRETFPFKPTDLSLEEISSIKENLIPYKPHELFPLWPTEEELKIFSTFEESVTELFTDTYNTSIIFPSQFGNNFNSEAIWLRPEDYIKYNLLNKEIKLSYPNKNIFKLRQDIQDFYKTYELYNKKPHEIYENEDLEEESKKNIFTNETENNMGDRKYSTYLNNETINKKRFLYKDFFSILEKKIDMKIVNYYLRDETDDEYKKRKDEENLEKIKTEKDFKGKKKQTNSTTNNNISPNIKEIKNLNNNLKENFNNEINPNEERLKIKEIEPSDLNFVHDPKYNSYLKWIVSILQMIKDLDINDSETGNSIFLNIYPQKNNFPIISPSGRYWIKLYLMGKPRKIEIDDLIPCSKLEEFIFPRCDKLEEIWPVLYTKAILKLHTYKRRHKYSEEIGDLSIIYAITGFIGEKMNINSLRLNTIENYLQSNLNYIRKNKIIACMFWREEILPNFPLNKNKLNKLSSKNSLISINSKYPQGEIEEVNKLSKNILNNISQNNLIKNLANKNIPIKNLKNDNTNLIEKKNSQENKSSDSSDNIYVYDHENLKKSNILTLESNISKEKEKEKIRSSKTTKYSEFINKIKNTITDSKLNPKNNSIGEDVNKKTNQMNINFTNINLPLVNVFEEKKNSTNNKKKNCNYLRSSKTILKFNLNDLNNKPDGLEREDILENYIYSVLDFFDNKKFNMQRLKPLDFSDIKKIIKEAKSPGVYKQLSKEEKKQYMTNLLELKNKQKELKNKRIEEIKKQGRKYNFVKIKSSTNGIPKLDFYIPFSEGQILISKKCLENKWQFPPPSYYDNDIKDTLDNPSINNVNNEIKNISSENKNDENNINRNERILDKYKTERNKLEVIEESFKASRENIRESIMNSPKKDLKDSKNIINPINLNINGSNGKTNKTPAGWNKDVFMNIINYNLEQYENGVEPLVKYNGGTWLNYQDFKKTFNFFILLHNPKSFKNYLNCDNTWVFNNDMFETNGFYSVIYLNNFLNVNSFKNNNTDDEYEYCDSDDLINVKKEKISENLKSNLLILFESNYTKDDINQDLEEVFFYANFDLIESTGKLLQNNIILSKFYSTFFNENLEKDKNYFLLMKSFVCPFGYSFSVYSDHAIDHMDYAMYLKKFYNFYSKNFKIDHIKLEKNKTFLISKFKIKLIEKTFFKINLNHTDKLAKKFIEIFLYFGNNSDVKKKINFDLDEKILFDPLLDEDDEYILVILMNPPYNINENSLDINILYDKDSAKIDLIDMLDPYYIYDCIKADKYGIIFKEFFFTNEKNYVTLDLSLRKNKNLSFSNHPDKSTIKTNTNLPVFNLDSQIYKKSPDRKRPEENNINIYNNFNNKIIYDEEKIENLRMKIKISKNNQIFFEEEFFNKLTIQNLLINGNSIDQTNKSPNFNANKEIIPYLIVCYLDLSELKIQREYLESLEWVLRVFSSELILITKDTSKLDSEKFLKDTWESREPGRSEKARKSRLKHLLLCKKKDGGKLSLEEENILLEERHKKKDSSTNIPNIEKNLLNNKNLIEKDKKNNNDAIGKKNTANKDEKINKILPILNENISKIDNKNFKTITEKDKQVIATSNLHKSNYIRNFLSYTARNRVIHKDNKLDNFKKTYLDDQLIKKKNEKINKQIELFDLSRKTEVDESFNKSILSGENLKIFYKTTNTFRMKSRENNSQLLKQRDFLRNELIKIQEIEKTIAEIITNNISDFPYIVNAYKESLNLEGIKQRTRERIFQFISGKKDEFYKLEIKKLTGKDRNVAIKYLEDLEENNWTVNTEILTRLNELVNDGSNININKK